MIGDKYESIKLDWNDATVSVARGALIINYLLYRPW